MHQLLRRTTPIVTAHVAARCSLVNASLARAAPLSSAASSIASSSSSFHLTTCRLFSAAPAKASTSLIKSLRETSGAPITECRDAIQSVLSSNSTDGSDAEVLKAAVEALRKKGISTAAKKSGRAASEGLVCLQLHSSKLSGSLIELNSETDFAARNTIFQDVAQKISAVAGEISKNDSASLETLLAASVPSSSSSNISSLITDTVANLRENIQLRRFASVRVKSGVVGTYMHNAITTDSAATTKMGRQGALIGIESSSSLTPEQQTRLQSIANKLAMHIVAASPRFLSRADVSAEVIAAERALLHEQALAPPIHVPGQAKKPESKKPKDAKTLERMVEGRIQKWLSEIVLMGQQLMVSGDAWDLSKPPTVQVMLEKLGKEFNTTLSLTGMARLLVGEGVQNTKTGDAFAKEVAEKLAKAGN